MIPPEIKHAPQDEIRERSKLEGRHLEGDDTHNTSQTSTMGSLGNVEEHHPLIEKTSTPSKLQQLEKLGMEIGQKIRKGTQGQMQNIKMMLLRVFGEKVDPARDNDAAARVLQKRINEEIKNLPKREEKVTEGEGQGPIMQGLPPSLPSQALGTISGMGSKLAHQIPSVNEMRDKISQYGHEVEKAVKHELAHVKQKFVQTFGEKVNPAKDLDSSVKDKLTRLNEDIRKLPRRNERVIETQGTAEEVEEVDPMDFDPNDPYENWI